jgi:hypothetical protein
MGFAVPVPVMSAGTVRRYKDWYEEKRFGRTLRPSRPSREELAGTGACLFEGAGEGALALMPLFRGNGVEWRVSELLK